MFHRAASTISRITAQGRGQGRRDGRTAVKREDDNVETFGKRLKSFHAQTEPMLQHYRRKSGRVVDIDCRKETDTVQGAKGGELFVNLKGDTSKSDLATLLRIVQSRFPQLAPAKAD